ncbi:MAG: TonB-dependent receptor SusC [Candidatus Ordinivivax streblomastigis]|uniref:TonB-dependent receptor SusC n=1 Tax=Candidatus Ordinivivax streblomastigis TaxID=2540710 RepID=A0A5M8P2Z1_9BACT|nr:MAG: TonB-dependent receptor SusC [Candidatus Ordinivivax streblomastigis]
MEKHNYILKGLSGLLLLFCFSPVFAQEKIVAVAGKDTMQVVDLTTVKGRIWDAVTQSPVLGAKIQSKDQKYSAMTDEKGLFTIQIPGYLTQLYISAPDYSLIECPLQGKSEIEVPIFRTTTSIRSLSALTVDAEITSKLNGDLRAITHSGTPGIGASMFIRGFNSLNAGSQPLIIVDGVIFDNQYDRTSIHEGFILNPLSNISPDDVESIQVIKDGTSLYGSKGGNGILMINTKRGKDPVTKITVSSLFGYNERPKTIPMLDANQFRVYASDLLKYSYNPSYISSLPFLNDNPSYYDYARYHNNNDWSKDVYRNSSTQSYNVGVSGGDDVALYHLSLGYANANSTLKANDFTRFNARFNSDIELTSKFKFSFDLSYAQTDRELRNDGFSESSNDVIASPAVLSLIKSPLLIPYEYSNTGYITPDLSDADIFDVANPIAIIEHGIGESSQTYLALSLKPSYQFTPALKLAGAFNYSLNSLFEKHFRPDVGVPTTYLPEVGGNSRNQVKAQNSKQLALAADLHLNWHKQYDKHVVDLTGGARFLSDSYKGEYGSGHNTSSDLDHNLNGSLNYRATTGYDDNWRSLSWYAQADYSLYEKYLLSLTASADASSRFGKEADLAIQAGGVNWGLFPSANAAWLVSSENFMRNLPFVNLLKIRLGYGFSGNDNIPNGAALTYFSAIRYINQYTGKTLGNIGNTSLKMETVEKKNVGIDISLLNNRLSVSGDWYHHTTSDLLAWKQFHYMAGLEGYWTNDGKLENKGYELSLNLKALTLRDFQWELDGSLAHYKNKILELPDGDYTTTIYGGEVQTAVGQPAGVFYGYKTDGVFATTAEATSGGGLKILSSTGVDYLPFTAGDIRFVDLHKDGIIDERDKTVIGDPNPDFTGSFNTRFSYKKLSISALFSFSYGNDIYNYVRSRLESGNELSNQSAAMQNRWMSEGQQTSIPKSSYSDPLGNSRFSNRWIEDGSYLRFKTLSVAYEVPVKWIFLSGFTIWASADNLWTYSKYLGVDPEFSINNSILYQGIDAGLLSQGRSYFIGLKLNL